MRKCAEAHGCKVCYYPYSCPEKKTNFETWKDSLTVDDFISAMFGDCESCPAYKMFDKCDHRKRTMYDPDCATHVRQWANQTADQ